MKTLFAGYKSAAFLAYLTVDVKGNANKYLHFDGEMYDYGNNYNPDTGIYTVPYDGMYFVHARLYGRDHTAAHFIVVDGKQVTYTVEDDVDSPSQATSTAIVLELRSGQEVAVQPNFRGDIDGYDGYMVTNFGAYMLYPN